MKFYNLKFLLLFVFTIALSSCEKDDITSIENQPKVKDAKLENETYDVSVRFYSYDEPEPVASYSDAIFAIDLSTGEEYESEKGQSEYLSGKTIFKDLPSGTYRFESPNIDSTYYGGFQFYSCNNRQ